MKTISRKRTSPSRQERGELKAWLARFASVPVDVGRLGDDEITELLAMKREGVDLARIGGARRLRWEELVAKAGSLAPDHFRRAREDARMFGEIRRLAAEALRPDPQPRHEEPGTVVFPPLWLAWMRQGRLPLESASLFLLVAAQLESGEAWRPGATVEAGADGMPVLALDANMGLGGAWDEDGVLDRWKEALRWLEGNDFLVVARRGKDWRIGYGGRALKARSGRKAGRAV